MGTNIWKKIIAILCIIAIILPISSEALAAITETAAGTKQTFGIAHIHSSKKLNGTEDVSFGYKVNEREAYRIHAGTNDYETTILCLDPTKKFPKEDETNLGNYVSLGEATEANLIKVNSNISSNNGAKKINWLIKNAILPEDSAELKEQKLSQIFNSLMERYANTENKVTLKDIKNYVTEDDLVFALQCTIWKITNNISTDVISGRQTETEEFDGIEGNDKWGYKGKKGEYIREIMRYYEENLSKNLEEDTTTKTNPSFDNTVEAKSTIEGTYTYIGPFKIKEATNYYSIGIKFEDKTGKELTDVEYSLTDKPSSQNVKIIQQTKEGLEGKNFYIKVRSSTAARKVKFNLITQVTIEKAEGTVWEDENKAGQPLLSIKRIELPGTEIPYEKEFDIVIEKQYDVALRKYIYAIKKPLDDTWKTIILEGNNSRNPGDAVKATGEEPFNQYEYRHRKDPLEVEVGDRVVYRITVYNEGKNEVVIKNIADYLPPSGIKFISDDNLNSPNWSYSSTNNRVVNPINQTLRGVNEDGIASATFQIVCEVTEAAKGKIVTNIAEITEIAVENESGTLVTVKEDIDSETSNIKLPETEEDWQKYKGNTEGKYANPDDLSKKDYYYKGQEDDDDFEKIKVKGENKIDLALRKSITHVNGKEVSPKRIGKPDTSPLKDGNDSTTTADYSSDKKVPPVDVNVGDIVAYKIRVFNEGDTDGYASIIEDYIPEGLGFIPQYIGNIQNGWTIKEGASGKLINLNEIENSKVTNSDLQGATIETAKVVTGKASIQSKGLEDNLIPAYDKLNDKLDDTNYLQLYCIVLDQDFAEGEKERVIRNIAAISQYQYKDETGKKVVVPEDIDSHGTSINPDTFNPSNHEDDEDYDDVVLKKEKKVYDLALKKFITGLTTADGTNKVIPEEQKRSLQVTNVDALVNRSGNNKADATYTLNKTPVNVADGDYITYTIRVFNEGDQDAVVKEIVDTVPEGLEFVPYEKNSDGTYKSGSKINYMYEWETFKDSVTTTGWKEGIKTKYLEETTISAFDRNKQTSTNKELGLSYTDVKVEFKVNLSKLKEEEKENILKNGIKNIAEITEDDGEDNDSTPNNKKETEDDEDYDIVIPVQFDLSLRKFITKIGNKEITDRIPKVTYKDGKLKYEHTKEPKIVVKGQVVTYIIRVYNEGTQNGYATEITDDLPEGITFLPEHETNIEYEWKMYDEEGKETTDVSKAKKIKTNYLSKDKGTDNLLTAFDKSKDVSQTNPAYKDVKVAFEVTQDNVTAGKNTIINTAQISEDEDEYGNEVEDIDSIPGNDKEDEDDIDKEYIILKYFDLSLLKYVSKVIVTEDGITKETETGYDGTENPEPVVKVELNKKKLDKTSVKYVYSIKITNEGEIEGYATEITDRIPNGLAFYEED
ncbi:MAG: DUF11 domain-containing protein, partial [Clostridia bacterium]|nr:DUF11 domain-containing protein [Clostridia bacterium]